MEEQVKKVSKIGLMRQLLEEDFYTKEELVEKTGVKHSTVNVQLSYHLKHQGYEVFQKDGKYHIVKKVDVSDLEQKKDEAVAEVQTNGVQEEEGKETTEGPSEEEMRRIEAEGDDQPATDEELKDLLNE